MQKAVMIGIDGVLWRGTLRFGLINGVRSIAFSTLKRARMYWKSDLYLSTISRTLLHLLNCKDTLAPFKYYGMHSYVSLAVSKEPEVTPLGITLPSLSAHLHCR